MLQVLRARIENIRYAQQTGRAVDADFLARLERLRDSAFTEFRTVTQGGRANWATSWCDKSARQLANASKEKLRPQQYTLLFSAWSEQTHGSPSTMLDEIAGHKGSDLESLLQADEPRLAETAAMAVVLLIELWVLLPAVPNLPAGKVTEWTTQLTAEALRYRQANSAVPDSDLTTPANQE